ncbi:MAG: alpha/beta fold hydrolase [Muribaculaceae bacterium]
MKRFLMIAVAVATALSVFADVVGKWQGELNVGGTQLPLVVRIADNGKVAWLDSPKQMAMNIECDTLTVAGNSITVGVKRMGILICGSLSNDNNFSGTFRQGLAQMPFSMSFVSNNPYLERPQTPQPPFPYDVQEVSFSHGDVTLTGTLTKPAGKKNLTAVVLVSGSGQQNRDEEVMGHRPFAVLADYLTRGDIAVLRYDDRGTGGSSACSPDVTTADFALDALAAVRYLHTVPEINKKKIGIVGHSEGGQIAIMLAAEHPKDVKFISTLAAPVVKGKDLMISQNEDMARSKGVEITPEQRNRLEMAFSAIDTITDVDVLRNRLYHIMTDGKSAQEMININSQIMVMTTPWYTHFVRYSAVPHLNMMRQPMLAFYGGHDVQVNATLNSATLGASYGGKKLEIESGLMYNHLFQECVEPTADYGNIEQTISPKVLQRLLDWIKLR